MTGPFLAAVLSLATAVVDDPRVRTFPDYGLSYKHLAGLTEFFRRLVSAGKVPDGSLAFLPAA